MEHYAGIDVSLESASICVVVDTTGRIMREAKVASEPEILICPTVAFGRPISAVRHRSFDEVKPV